MDDQLKAFLIKFAELERRVRKLAVEDRGLRREVSAIKERLAVKERETAALSRRLAEEEAARGRVREQLARLIERLERLKAGSAAELELEAEGNDHELGA